MKMCLGCENLKVNKVEYKGEDIPEIFETFLELYCIKKKNTVVGYNEKGSNTYCEHFTKKLKESM